MTNRITDGRTRADQAFDSDTPRWDGLFLEGWPTTGPQSRPVSGQPPPWVGQSVPMSILTVSRALFKSSNVELKQS